jgi:hypothetical protein
MNDSQLKKLIEMAVEAERLQASDTQSARAIAGRLEAARQNDLTGPSPDEIELLVRGRLSRTPRGTRTRWRNSAAILVAAGVVGAIMLWPASMPAPTPAPGSGGSSGPRAAAGAESRSDAIRSEDARSAIADAAAKSGASDFDRPLQPEASRSAARAAMAAMPGAELTLATAQSVLVLVKDSTGRCGCKNLRHEEWAAESVRGVASDGSRVVYARAEGEPTRLNVNDFACFNAHFAAGDPTSNCDGSTVGPMLSINDFLCFTSRFAAGCT